MFILQLLVLAGISSHICEFLRTGLNNFPQGPNLKLVGSLIISWLVYIQKQARHSVLFHL